MKISSAFQTFSKNVVFKGIPVNDPEYENAKKYRDERSGDFFGYREYIDLNKMNGIQNGIDIFNGMKLREIMYSLINVFGFAATRGCKNQCGHCYAEANPPVKENEKTINKMSFEDFKDLMQGLYELQERMGFDIVDMENPFMRSEYFPLFYDSDNILTVLKDENGCEHDFIELNNLQYDATGIKGLFDTAGWAIQDKKSQALAEKYAAYYSQEKEESLINFNLSLNPFHYINMQSVKYKELGMDVKAKTLQKHYVDRMANVLFTLTPMLDSPKFQILARASKPHEKMATFDSNALSEIIDGILDKLKLLYKEDQKSANPKFITSDKDIIRLIGKCKELTNEKDTRIDLTIEGRFKELWEKRTGQKIKYGKNLWPKRNTLVNKIIDANGKVYLLDDNRDIIPTNLQFNFRNKDKQTAPLGPNLKTKVYDKKKIKQISKYDM